MTEKDRLLQKLFRENEGLKEELRMIVECCRVCRFCKNADADCSPTDGSCKAEWRGLNGKTPD